jgi:hypothetical protein
LRELAHDLRQFAVAGSVEREGDLALAGLLGLGHVAVVGRQLRVILLERVEREDDVVRRDRLAVVPARLGTQAIGHRGEVSRVADGVGEQAVFGRNLVER